MPIKQISLQRFSVISPKSFTEVLTKIESAIGHPDMAAFGRGIKAAKTFAELEGLVNRAVGPSGLMEFIRFDLGEVLRKEHASAPKSLRLLVGNPLIMKRMVEHVPDAGSYAPVTILIDEGPDGVRVSYDRLGSFLGPYEHAEALKVAQELDAKVESLLVRATT